MPVIGPGWEENVNERKRHSKHHDESKLHHGRDPKSSMTFPEPVSVEKWP
jgi:hypothetical protein